MTRQLMRLTLKKLIVKTIDIARGEKMKVLLILAIILLFIMALLFIPAYVGIEYTIKDNTKKAFIILRIFKVIPIKIILKKNIKKKKKKITLEKYIETAAHAMDAYKESKDLIKEVLKGTKEKITFYELVFDVDFGTGNAASTGIMTGAVWSATDIFVCIIDRIFGVKKFKVNVNPQFDKKCFSGQFKSILKFRLVNIIIILNKILRVFKIFNEHINKNEKQQTN